jgi:hypothetical protein
LIIIFPIKTAINRGLNQTHGENHSCLTSFQKTQTFSGFGTRKKGHLGADGSGVGKALCAMLGKSLRDVGSI